MSARLSADEYRELVGRIQATVSAHVPPGSSLLVVSKGDTSLLELPGRTALHFPQDGSGGYAGHHPRDGATATAELEQRRRAGAEYLVLPATSRWWLRYYEDFAQHLTSHGEVVVDLPGTCTIYSLGPRLESAPGVPAIERPQASAEQIRDYLERLITVGQRLVVLETIDGLVAALGTLETARLRAGEDDRNTERTLAELRLLADDGADYLVVPRSSDEWLDSRPQLAAEIENNCRKIAEQRHLCRVFDLEGLKETA
jgi:hypothetical protein